MAGTQPCSSAVLTNHQPTKTSVRHYFSSNIVLELMNKLSCFHHLDKKLLYLGKGDASVLCEQTLMHKHLDFTNLMGCNVLVSTILTNTLSLVLFSFRQCVYEFSTLPVYHLGSIRPHTVIYIIEGEHYCVCLHNLTRGGLEVSDMLLT